MTRDETEALAMALASASIGGLLSGELSGRVIGIVARLDLSSVDAESAEEMYAHIMACMKQNEFRVNPLDRRAWTGIADRFASHAQRLNNPTGRKMRNVVR